jgi:hypothetical protein
MSEITAEQQVLYDYIETNYVLAEYVFPQGKSIMDAIVKIDSNDITTTAQIDTELS